VVGKIEKDAISALDSAGLRYSKSYEYNDTVEAGKVISQSPTGGSVDKGSTVALVISQGQKSITVPSVLNDSEAAATSTLTAAGLKVKTKTAYSDTVEEGLVISQSVAKGKIVPAGTAVTITISQGPEEKFYSFSKTYNAPENAVSATYTVVGSDGVTYDSGTVDVSGSLNISVSDMDCASGNITITWTIETIDEEGLQDTTTKTENYSVKFTRQ
jgi:serine/threonine-protein kinase